jgi:hypothetical protein
MPIAKQRIAEHIPRKQRAEEWRLLLGNGAVYMP